jgi:hypothetical protein
MSSGQATTTTIEKALQVNLDEKCYGTIVEIGAGQEVARLFFKAGAAAGTVAKTMSAYDMQISDDIYGKADRYVGKTRLLQMLNHEHTRLLDRLSSIKPKACFFSYAATVTARNYTGSNECHGWIGLRFQQTPGGESSDIILHVRMLDDTYAQQADALGILGINLIHSATHRLLNPKEIIDTLSDNLGSDRIEVDLIHFEGSAFSETDNRLMNLQLIRSWLTRAVMFDESGASVVPRDKLYKKPILVMRGSYKPPTRLHADMRQFGDTQFKQEQAVDADNVVHLAEITMSELVGGGELENEDFISRVDLLTSQGYNVLISDYVRFFRLRSWLRNHTNNHIGITLSVLDFNYLFDEEYYRGIEGGILEAMGKLFPDNTHVYVYPAIIDGQFIDLHSVSVSDDHKLLLQYLIHGNKLKAYKQYNINNLHISARSLFKQIPEGSGKWEKACLPEISEAIKARGLFGFKNNR